MRLRDLLREAEPVTVHERSATQSLANWDRIAARIVTVNGRQIISGGLLPFGLEASATLIAAFHDMASKPAPDAGFDVTDRAQLLRHRAPMFTAMWLLYLDRKRGVSGKSVSVRVALGGGRI